MATLLIDIRDVTTQPIKGDTVTLTAPAPRPATGGGVTRPFSRLVPLDDLGRATVEVDPGPLRVTFHDGYGREVVIDTRVPDDGDVFTLRDLIVTEIGDLDDVPGIREALDGKADEEHQHQTSDIEDLDDALESLRDGVSDKADEEHRHLISDVVELQDKLDHKAETHHLHETSDIDGLGNTLKSLRDDIDSTAPAKHSHEINNVNGLRVALDGKANKAHNHTIAEIKDLIWSLDQKVSITDLEASTKRYASVKIAELVDGAPESLDTLREVAEEFKNQDKAIEAVFTELGKRAMKSHTHTVGDVTGLQSALDGKAAKSHTHGLEELVGLSFDGMVSYVSRGYSNVGWTRFNPGWVPSPTWSGMSEQMYLTLRSGRYLVIYVSASVETLDRQRQDRNGTSRSKVELAGGSFMEIIEGQDDDNSIRTVGDNPDLTVLIFRLGDM